MPIAKTKSTFMSLALEEARAAAVREEVPIGAIILDGSGQIIARAGNRTEELADPTAHAEMEVIRQACAIRGEPRLPDCSLYVTLEPCPMCATAISFARIQRLYYAAPDPKGGGVEHGPRIFHQPTCHHKPELYPGIGEDEAAELLRTFFQARR
ncbi:MAG: nucleoside deaminase [Rhodospirillaceae bacterium]|nr:nucleoside deaminase [Rhodospirillaceae bacterium]MBT4689187.1 nucleoside deaminase [Rhodospirillaceae bacterium]MBT5080814.1 nucleoside deaminase [Rhodospirillaceae bacterium]MBT5525235.1 nucleoside deaminase [Rhodospirillaceae bacterium]MBT5877804.1 nucleoside deaminase [Rhodospirillaceae bacterium]